MIIATLKGSNNSSASSATISVTSVSIAAHATVHVSLSHAPVGITSVTWNGNALIQDATVTNSDQLSEWSLHDCTSGTGDVVVTFASAITDKILVVTQLTADVSAATISTDVSTTNTGTAASATTGTTASPAATAEFSLFVVGRRSVTAWTTTAISYLTVSHSFIQGALASGSSRLSVGGRMTDANTGEAGEAVVSGSGNWAALIVLYRESTARRVVLGAGHRTQFWKQRRIELAAQHRTIWYIEGPDDGFSFSSVT